MAKENIVQEVKIYYDINTQKYHYEGNQQFSMSDENSCRIIYIFTKDGENLVLGGYTARAFFKSPEKLEYQYDYLVVGNEVVIDLPTSVLSKEGTWYIQLIVTNGVEKKASFLTYYSVANTLEGAYEEALNEPSLITQLENKINDRYTKAEVDTKFENLGEISSTPPIISSPTNPMKQWYFWKKTQGVI